MLDRLQQLHGLFGRQGDEVVPFDLGQALAENVGWVAGNDLLLDRAR